ncbi:unnamed protein product [Sphenostylis stenocarpa]|uniref:TIR domain-containing protein n=1 Tax=Sphenostylis stenocarpa TaxID=92480 RepID=A0AA86W5B8_9FABA|nr:unnamed protein product [Sphenostylis stenocarpa]
MACRQIQRSSSSRTKNFDVFVSFRSDTRNGFTDHLFAALQRKDVLAFRDDQTIKKGEFLESELLRAIEGSRVFIVVFSKDYASSTWCMKELTKIVETGRSLLPIFYDVTPSEVRKQSGEFAEAFAQHEERFKDDLEMLQKWREALKTSADRCGWDMQNKQQNEEIENIVEEVINILGYNQILSFGDDLVDMHSRVKQLEELLDLGANDVVGLVGIWKKLLDYREFYPDIGMKVLIEKSLISCRDGEIQMHDLLQELGKSIVREEAPKEPRKWSRLWDYKDLQKAMKINTEAKNLEAIVIEQRPEEFVQERIRVDALSKINHLQLLILKKVNTFGSLNCISNELRYLNWDNFPFVSLPSTFEPDQLVELQLRYSNIKKLWEGTKILPKLRTLDLCHSKNLIEMPDLTGVPHLTSLRLKGCIELVQIDPSIGILRELIHLDLKNCKNLVLNLNIIFGLGSLRGLNLSGCSKLLNSKMLMEPRDTQHLEKVDKNTSVVQRSTSSVYKLLILPFNFLSSPKPEDSLGLLLPYLSRFQCLSHLDLSFCNLLQIPDAIGNLHSLVGLNLGGNKFVTLPCTIKQLSKLERLNLEHCKKLKYFPELPITKDITIGKYWWRLYLFYCPSLSDIEHCYRMVTSWMTQNLEVYLQRTISSAMMEIVIPGSQIPKWFNKQNARSSISVDLSSVMDDPNWIGVAFCVLFITHEDPTNLSDGRNHHDDCIAYGVHNKHLWPKRYIHVPIYFEKDLVTVELDHLFTVFYSREEFIGLLTQDPDKMLDPAKLEFEIISDHFQGLRVVLFWGPGGYSHLLVLSEYEERLKDDMEMVHKWRDALKAITNRYGWDVQNK